MYQLLTTLFLLLTYQLCADESITGKDAPYRSMCLKAATSSYYFQRFRSFPEYYHALEFQDGRAFEDYLKHDASKDILEKIEVFRRLDYLGNPITQHYSSLGKFSATTLRYIAIADHIKKLFDLPPNAKIVEVGAGFGGQCFILSQVVSCSKYYIYDLPEPNALIEKMMKMLDVKQSKCLTTDSSLPEDKVDLFISNYAYSECELETQMDYFERVIKKADRGYIIYNQTSDIYGLHSLTPQEFIELLEKNGMCPKSYDELVHTFDGNILIIWDRCEKKGEQNAL